MGGVGYLKCGKVGNGSGLGVTTRKVNHGTTVDVAIARLPSTTLIVFSNRPRSIFGRNSEEEVFTSETGGVQSYGLRVHTSRNFPFDHKISQKMRLRVLCGG